MNGPQPRVNRYTVRLTSAGGEKLCLFAEGPYLEWVERWAKEKYEVDPKSKDFASVTSVKLTTDAEDGWRSDQKMKYVDTCP